MNPVVIIPTYHASGRKSASKDILDTYDHMTPLSHQGELPRCLASFRDQGINVPIAILVVAEAGKEQAARDKVVDIANHYGDLDIAVIAVDEEQGLHDRMTQLGIGGFIDGIGLAGYGPVKNLGLIYAVAMGYDSAIFIDDDEIIDDPEFIEKACYGLGMMTQNNVPVLIKSGYFTDKSGDYHAKVDSNKYNELWNQHKIGFNEWIDSAMRGSRLSVSSSACGGCLAIHREAMKRVSFDPWITRGEDLDYLLNVKMYGSEIWFDNEWHLSHRPPKTNNEVTKFVQDSYRWLFESRKLEYLRSQIDLIQINTAALEPYPGIMIGLDVEKIITKTARKRALGCKGKRKAYFSVMRKDIKDAQEYAASACSNYFPFQYQWPEVVAMLTDDIALRGIFENARSEAAPRVEPEDDFAAPADASAEVAVEAQAEAAVETPAVQNEEIARELADFELDLSSFGLDDIDV